MKPRKGGRERVVAASRSDADVARMRVALHEIQAQAALLACRAERNGDTTTLAGLHLLTLLSEEALSPETPRK